MKGFSHPVSEQQYGDASSSMPCRAFNRNVVDETWGLHKLFVERTFFF